MEKVIYEYKNSLSNDLCKELITFFNNTDRQYQGVVSSGINLSVKKTTDVILDERDFLYEALNNELKRHLNIFVKELWEKYKIDFRGNLMNQSNKFQLQRYIKNEGYFKYHNDSSVVKYQNTNISRIFAYIWYLNDVTEGGETEFLNNEIKIKPMTGKLVIFPASQYYPHSGLMPISDDKYIVTGWICKEIHIQTH